MKLLQNDNKTVQLSGEMKCNQSFTYSSTICDCNVKI